MNIAETISVNPVSKTLGALHFRPETALNFLSSESAKSLKQKRTEKNSFSKFLFASSSPSVKGFGKSMLVFRLLFSALLIVSGSFILSGEISATTNLIEAQYLGLGEIIIGSMLALGFLSRFAMGVSTVFFGYIAAMSIMSGVFDAQALMWCLGSLVFLTMGTGKYSSDFLIRKAIVLRSRRRERELRENRLSYRAFRIHNM
ncbi:MAG: DoxX family protein [Muribaculaceae bacterium]|nr:DoxX family protein [Muribaculaceae bacterium]